VSILGPVLINIFINYLDDGAEHTLDTKQGGVADTPDGCIAIQGTSTGWRNGLIGNLCNSTKGNAKSCTGRSEQHQLPVDAGSKLAGKQLHRKGSGIPGGHQVKHEPETCLCGKK